MPRAIRQSARLALAAAVLAVTAGCVGGGPTPEALRWVHYVDPVYPPELLATRVQNGFASLVFTFDDTGRVTDRVVIAASHPAFTAAVLETTPHWQLDTRELARRLRRETLRFDFHRAGSVVTLTNRDAAKAAFSPYGDQVATAVTTCREAALDRPLHLVTSVHAEYPPALKIRGARGHATIGFIVDAAGRVRVPAVTDATDADFGEVALAAIRRWQFAPAHQAGRPVQVMVERTFVFGAAGDGK